MQNKNLFKIRIQYMSYICICSYPEIRLQIKTIFPNVLIINKSMNLLELLFELSINDNIERIFKILFQ